MNNKIIDGGLFITLEGGEGAGKTTLSKKLYDYYTELGYNVILTREPGGTEVGKYIRNLVNYTELDEKTKLYMYALDRHIHIDNVIRPALEAGKIIICDRYMLSSLIYDGIVDKIDIEEVFKVHPFDVILPHIELLLNVKPETSMDRVNNNDREKKTINDSKPLEFHKLVNESYKYMTYAQSRFVIDANNSESYVSQQAIRFIDGYINGMKLLTYEG